MMAKSATTLSCGLSRPGPEGPWSNVRIEWGSIGPRLSWVGPDWRYHVWLDPETMTPSPMASARGRRVVYANVRDDGHGECRHRTETRDANAKRWDPVVRDLLAGLDIPAERRRHEEAERASEAEQAATVEVRARAQRLRDAASELRTLVEIFLNGTDDDVAMADRDAVALLARIDGKEA